MCLQHVRARPDGHRVVELELIPLEKEEEKREEREEEEVEDEEEEQVEDGAGNEREGKGEKGGTGRGVRAEREGGAGGEVTVVVPVYWRRRFGFLRGTLRKAYP
jgi:hypothetical protein